MNFLTKAAVAVLLSAGIAQADGYTLGNLEIAQPMAFETAKNANVGGGYMTISNKGTEADRLVEVRVANIPRVELHLSETDANGVARMIKQNGIDIPAGVTVTLKPGGLHVMFMGIKDDPFEAGEEIPATLLFETSGAVAVTFNVRERSAGDHSGMDHSGQKLSDE